MGCAASTGSAVPVSVVPKAGSRPARQSIVMGIAPLPPVATRQTPENSTATPRPTKRRQPTEAPLNPSSPASAIIVQSSALPPSLPSLASRTPSIEAPAVHNLKSSETSSFLFDSHLSAAHRDFFSKPPTPTDRSRPDQPARPNSARRFQDESAVLNQQTQLNDGIQSLRQRNKTVTFSPGSESGTSSVRTRRTKTASFVPSSQSGSMTPNPLNGKSLGIRGQEGHKKMTKKKENLTLDLHHHQLMSILRTVEVQTPNSAVTANKKEKKKAPGNDSLG
jgi:hypothetical protein